MNPNSQKSAAYSRLPQALIIATSLACGLAALFKIAGNDIWWHVRTGQWMWDHGELLERDVFSHTHASEPLGYTDVLAQLFWGALDAAGGPGLMVWAKVALVALLAWLVARATRELHDPLLTPVSAGLTANEANAAAPAGQPSGSVSNPGAPKEGTSKEETCDEEESEGGSAGERTKTLLLAGSLGLVLPLTIAACMFRLTVRPEIFSFLFFAVALGIIYRADRLLDPRRLLWLLPLLLVWGNTHRGGTIVLPLLVALAASWGISWGLGRDARDVSKFVWLAGIMAVSVPVLMLNPGGVDYVLAAFQLASSATFASGISEWTPTSWELLLDLHVPLVLMTVLWALGWAIRRRRLDVATLVVLGLWVLGWRSMRLLPFVAIAMAPALAWDGAALLRWLVQWSQEQARPVLLAPLMVVVGMGLLAGWYVQNTAPERRGAGFMEKQYPVEAIDWLEDNPPPGPMYNGFNLAGYALYRLGPEKKVFIDGRTQTLYSEDFLQAYFDGITDPEVLRQQLEEHEVTWALLDLEGTGDDRYRGILDDESWVMVYWGDRVAVLVKYLPGPNSDYLFHHSLPELHPHTVLGRLGAWEAEPRKNTLARDIFKNLERAPHSLLAHYLAAIVLYNEGREEEYRQEKSIVEQMARERGEEVPELPDLE